MSSDPSSIFILDEATRRRFLRLAHGPWGGRRLRVELSACENPFCHCSDVSFRCAPEDSPSPQPQQGLCFALDVIEREVSRTDPEKPTLESLALAEAVVAELGERDWEWLYDEFLHAKHKAMEDIDLLEFDPVFPPKAMAGEGIMVQYREILPFAMPFPFKIGGAQWLADDAYCIEPHCTCRDVLIRFLHIRDTPVGRGARVKEKTPDVFYNYQRGTLRTAQEPAPGQPSISELVDTMKRAHPDFDREAEYRHLQLKMLFVRALLKSPQESATHEPAPPAPGRNDPCPCGSGKKFKKCCGK